MVAKSSTANAPQLKFKDTISNAEKQRKHLEKPNLRQSSSIETDVIGIENKCQFFMPT